MRIRGKQRVAKRYAFAVTVKPPCGNPQKISVRSCSRDSSILCRWEITPDYCDAEEDDMHLFDIPTQQPPSLDPNHEFSKLKGGLVLLTLEKFLLEVRHRNTANSACEGYLQKGTDSGQEMHEGDTNLSRSFTPFKHHLACPFYTHSPKQHTACFTRADLRDIEGVKQHLWNAHQLPPYCPCCGEVFTTSETCSEHIRSRSCSTREMPLPEGITVQQMQQLARRAEPWMTKELQWLSIWAIVFPGVDLPAVAYPSNAIESMVCLFRDYWSLHGEKIVSNFLEEKELRSYELRDEERGLTALYFTVLHEAIDRLVESFKQEDYNTVPEKIEQVLASLHLI